MSAGSPASNHDAEPPRVLVQLVAPGTGGVRDYLECLQQQWQSMGLTNHVISLSATQASEQPLVDRLRSLIAQERRPLSLVLHFSGYGFHPRGLCWWLVRELEQCRHELGDQLRVVTMFHELFASGPPWRSAFWVGGMQASIARRVARGSDFILTNTDGHGRWLRAQVAASVPISVYPVFSTIGEPASMQPSGPRALSMVVFGSQSTRARALDLLPRHAQALNQAGVGEVVEVGSGSAYPWTDQRLTHSFAGRLEVSDLALLLDRSAFGLIDYPPRYLGKSTVFAAYAAHGCVTLNTAAAGEVSDGLEPGRHFLALDTFDGSALADADRRLVTDAARQWYGRHTLPSQATAFAVAAGAIRGVAPSPGR